MNIFEIQEVLINRGYSEKLAKIVADELINIDSHLNQELNLWLVNEEETDVVYRDISLKDLQSRFKLTYPAALLSMDWIYKEPEIALSAMKLNC